jgi:hypothetical protein
LEPTDEPAVAERSYPASVVPVVPADWLASTGGGTDAGLSRIPGSVNGRDVQDLMWWMSFASEKNSGHSLCGKECQTAIGDRGHQQRRVEQGVVLDSEGMGFEESSRDMNLVNALSPVETIHDLVAGA